jgi:hypothetical protein
MAAPLHLQALGMVTNIIPSVFTHAPGKTKLEDVQDMSAISAHISTLRKCVVCTGLPVTDKFL